MSILFSINVGSIKFFYSKIVTGTDIKSFTKQNCKNLTNKEGSGVSKLECSNGKAN